MRPPLLTAACLTILTVVCQATVHDVPGEFSSIQSAIVAADPGDTVLVAPGVYAEELDYLGKPVVVGSWYVTTGNLSYVDSTVVDGEGVRGPLVTFASGEDSLSALVGFTLREGRALRGGAIFCNLSAPRVSQCALLLNEALSDGGGIYADEADPIVEDCRFESNYALDHSGGGFGVRHGSPRISGCVFSMNYAHDEGGAIFSEDSSPHICDNVIDGNNAYVSYAGGIMSRNCTPVIEGNVISNNETNHLGGGLFY